MSHSTAAGRKTHAAELAAASFLLSRLKGCVAAGRKTIQAAELAAASVLLSSSRSASGEVTGGLHLKSWHTCATACLPGGLLRAICAIFALLRSQNSISSVFLRSICITWFNNKVPKVSDITSYKKIMHRRMYRFEGITPISTSYMNQTNAKQSDKLTTKRLVDIRSSCAKEVLNRLGHGNMEWPRI